MIKLAQWPRVLNLKGSSWKQLHSRYCGSMNCFVESMLHKWRSIHLERHQMEEVRDTREMSVERREAGREREREREEMKGHGVKK